MPPADQGTVYTTNGSTTASDWDQFMYLPLGKLTDVELSMNNYPLFGSQLNASQIRFPSKSLTEIVANYRNHLERMRLSRPLAPLISLSTSAGESPVSVGSVYTPASAPYSTPSSGAFDLDTQATIHTALGADPCLRGFRSTMPGVSGVTGTTAHSRRFLRAGVSHETGISIIDCRPDQSTAPGFSAYDGPCDGCQRARIAEDDEHRYMYAVPVAGVGAAGREEMLCMACFNRRFNLERVDRTAAWDGA